MLWRLVQQLVALPEDGVVVAADGCTAEATFRAPSEAHLRALLWELRDVWGLVNHSRTSALG